MNKIKNSLAIILAFLLLILNLSIVDSTQDKSIDISLEYKTGTVWDSDDNGMESDKAAVDFTVENTKFSWQVDETKLCTRWETYALDKGTITVSCYGSAMCCNFMGLAPLKPNWNDIFFSQYGKHGASYNNKISARVIYIDYSLSENPYSHIYYSDFDYLYATHLDHNYFNNILAKDTTSDKEYLAAVNSLERLKAKNNLSKITITDKNDNKIQKDLKNNDIKINFYIDSNDEIVASINNIKESDLDWNKLEDISIKKDDKALNRHIASSGLIPRKSITIRDINNVLNQESYNGAIEFKTKGISYTGVMYCDDSLKCSLMPKCVEAEENCYKEDSSSVEIFIPHFSSVILVLNNSAVNIDITSPDDVAALESGENVYLNFTANITITANYSLDNGIEKEIGTGTTFSDLLYGALNNGVLSNGIHNITINIKDEYNFANKTSYSFTVNDSYAPFISVLYNGTSINNTLIHKLDSSLTAAIISNEYSNLSYKLNNGNLTSLGIEKLFNLYLTPAEWANNLTIYAADLHSNYQELLLYFNFTSLHCSDAIQNGDETGIDCGGSCAACFPFNVSLEKQIFNLSENVRVTVKARTNSTVYLTALFGNEVVYSELITSYSPGQPIFYTTTLGNINKAGNYTINATMFYLTLSESSILNFYVNDTTKNPLSLSITSNASIINEMESVSFTANVDGGSSYSYAWDFNNDRLIDSTSGSAAYAFERNGTYIVNLTIISDKWSKSATKEIIVRKLFNVTVIIKNESDELVEDARIELNNIIKNTSIDGIATFLIYEGSHSLNVRKTYYSDFSNNTNINSNLTLDVKLGHIQSDNEKPIIQISNPDSNQTISAKSFTIVFRVLDSSETSCKLYSNFNKGSWEEKASFTSIKTNEEISFALDNLEEGFYELNIECVDYFSNSETSETRSLNISLDAIENTDKEAEIEGLIKKVDDILSNLEYSGINEKEAAVAIQFEEQLKKAKTQLERVKRDLNNVVWRRLNNTGIEKEREAIVERAEEIKRNTPISIKVIETKEFINYPEKEAIKNLSLELLNFENSANKKKKEKEEKAYTESIEKLQSMIRVTTKAKILEVEYLSGELNEITLIEKEVSTEKGSAGLYLIESIPKEIADNISSVTILFEYEVIKEDPIIKIGLPIEKYVEAN